MQRDVATPEDYLNDIPEWQRPTFDLLHSLIMKVVPQGTQTIRYGMLAFDEGEIPQFSLAAQKNMVCLYVSTEAVAELADELADINHGKCCLRFKRPDSVPVPTILKLLKRSRAIQRRTGKPGC